MGGVRNPTEFPGTSVVACRYEQMRGGVTVKKRKQRHAVMPGAYFL